MLRANLRPGTVPVLPARAGIGGNARAALPLCRSLRDGVNPVNAVAAQELQEGQQKSDELAQALAASGIDMSISGLATISDEAKVSFIIFILFWMLLPIITSRNSITNNIFPIFLFYFCSCVLWPKKPTNSRK